MHIEKGKSDKGQVVTQDEDVDIGAIRQGIAYLRVRILGYNGGMP